MSPIAPIALICPGCRTPLTREPDEGYRCSGCDAVYPRRAEVDVFLPEDEWLECRAHLDEERSILERYAFARRHVPHTVAYYDWWVSQMYAQVPESARGPVIELMCGAGEVCRRLPARFDSAFALDLNVMSVEQGARDLLAKGDRRVHWACGTAARLPLPDACTDVVIVQGALHHARPLLAQILGEVARILKPNGVYVGSEPANDHWLTRAIRHWQYRHSSMQGHDPDEDGFSRDDLAGAFARAGMRLDGYQQFGFIAYPFMANTDMLPVFAAPFWSRSLRPLMAFDELLTKVPGIRRLAWASLFRAFKG